MEGLKTMKINKKMIWNIIMAIVFLIGWMIVIKVGKHQDYRLLLPLSLWGGILFRLARGMDQAGEMKRVRKTLMWIICSHIALPLSAFIGGTTIIILAAFAMECVTVSGLIIIANELLKKKNGKKSKSVSVEQKPHNDKGGKKTDVHGKKQDSNYKPEDVECSACGLLFLRADLHEVEGMYYCQTCFERNYVDDSDAEAREVRAETEIESGMGLNVELTSEEESKKEHISCFSTIKNLFTCNYEKQPETSVFRTICDHNIYIIYTYETKQPLCYMDQLCAFDSYEKAVNALDQHLVNGTFREYFYPQEVTPEHMAEEVKKYLSSGFEKMVVNQEYLVELSDLPVYDEDADYGIVNPTACNYMICYKERLLSLQCDEDTENRNRLVEDAEMQKALFSGIVRALGQGVLLIPDEKHRKKNADNKQVLIVFTDRFALNAYDAGTSIRVTETDLDELYRLAEEDETISGIVVNPGREDFRMQIKMKNSFGL